MATASSLFERLWLAPAEHLLVLVDLHAPALGSATGLLPGALSPAGMTVLSAACWIACGFLTWLAARWLRYTIRLVEFMLHNAAHHVRAAWKHLRTWWTVRILRQRPSRAAASITSHAVDFSAMDVAVLTATARLKPGFAVSAPELATRLKRRPGEVQQSLEKLYRIKLLDVTLGSTDGFDNYVISTSGAVLGSMLQNNKRLA